MPSKVVQRTQWRGQPDTTRRRLVGLLALSVLFHVPLTPIAALLGLLTLLFPQDEQAAAAEQIEAIPVSLLSAEELEQLGGKAAEPQPKAAEPAPAAAESDDDLMEQLLAEDEPKPAEEEPKPPSTGPDGGVAKTEEPGADAGGGPEAEEQPLRDPVALAGAASSVADPNANVRLMLLNERVRGHPLGARLGPLLARLPQWRSFFGPTGIDPIRDLDGMFAAGPQLRVSDEVVAVLSYNVPQQKMRAALDAIVQREPKGQWLSTRIPAARARADRAERTFVLARPGIVMMVPPRLTDDAIKKAPHASFPKIGGNAALVAFIATPWRVLLGVNAPIDIPRSIRSVMLAVSPRADGGVDLRLEALDESPEAAAQNAVMLSHAINLVTQRNMGALGALLFGGQTLRLIEPVAFRADGSKIVGTARATQRQVDRILNFAESWLDSYDRRMQPPAPVGSSRMPGGATEGPRPRQRAVPPTAPKGEREPSAPTWPPTGAPPPTATNEGAPPPVAPAPE